MVLDFWTFCCINCLHVLDELRPLEERYGDVLAVIGVHSPKFEHEKDPAALAAAVERYGVAHPVLDDAEMRMWQQYAARAWPTLVVIDPEGYVVATMAGEGHADGLARLIDELITTHEAKGTLRRGDGPVRPARRPGHHAALSRQGHRVRRTGFWSRTRPVTRSWSWPATVRRSAAVSAPAGGDAPTVPPRTPPSPNRRGSACSPSTPPRSPGTTSSSPTPSTTRCAG